MKRTILALTVVMWFTIGCSEDGTPVSIDTEDGNRRLGGAIIAEEEVLGRVWHNGMLVTGSSPRFFIRLEPDLDKDPDYWDRAASLGQLTQAEFSSLQPVDPSRMDGAHWGWYFPDQNAGVCEKDSIGNPLRPEQHRDDINGQLVLSQSGPERHCIVTGRFVVSLLNAQESVIASREIDFISGSTGLPATVEDTFFGPDFVDNVVHFDPQGFPGMIFPVIDSVPVGAVSDVFEFDAGNTSPGWFKDSSLRGLVSVKWIWDVTEPTDASSFMNTQVTSGVAVRRTHQYGTEDTRIVEAQFANPAGGTASRQLSVEVINNPFFPPGQDCAFVAVLGPGPPEGLPPGFQWWTEVSFRVVCAETAGGASVEHRWDFDDGEDTGWMSGTTEMSHLFAGPAVYTTMLDAREIGNPTNAIVEQFMVDVTDPPPDEPVATVTVSPSSTTIEEGENDQLTATTKDAQGNVLTGRTITWTKNNSNITLSPSGQNATITGISAGSTTVTATSEGVSGNSSITITAPPPPVNDATAGGNSFPASLQQAVFYAVSANMTNTGNTTWTSGGGYSFRKKSPWGAEWLPMSVSLGSSVAPGQPKTFTFNLYSEAASGQSYNLEYQMYQNSTWFGDVSSRNIFIFASVFCMTCDLYAFDDVGPGELIPGGAVWGNSASSTQPDTLQVLIVEDYPLLFEEEDGSDVAHVMYYGSLAEKWEVDVTFRIMYDSKAVSYGQTQRGVNLLDYEVEVENEGPGVVKINLNRLGMNAGLKVGEELFLDIPIVGRPGKALPATLSRVEVIVTQ